MILPTEPKRIGADQIIDAFRKSRAENPIVRGYEIQAEIDREMVVECRRLVVENTNSTKNTLGGHMKRLVFWLRELDRPSLAWHLEVPRWKSCLIDWGRIFTLGLWKP